MDLKSKPRFSFLITGSCPFWAAYKVSIGKKGRDAAFKAAK